MERSKPRLSSSSQPARPAAYSGGARTKQRPGAGRKQPSRRPRQRLLVQPAQYVRWLRTSYDLAPPPQLVAAAPEPEPSEPIALEPPQEDNPADEELFLSSLYDLGSAAQRGLSYAMSRFGSAPARPSVPAPAPAPMPRVPAPAPSLTRLPVPESALTNLLQHFRDYAYDLKQTYYPWPVPGVSLPQAPPKLINCCTFAEALITKAWANQHGTAFQWNSRRHAQMMVMAEDLYSPIAAAIDAQLGVAVPQGQPPTTWCLAQGWRSSSSGHTFIIVARHAPSDRLLILEANKYDAVSGVGYRGMGNLRDFPSCRPPLRWWENPAAPTWAALSAAYGQGLKLAKLNVTNLSWAGIS